jgi:DNA-binding response OmpR family regulator
MINSVEPVLFPFNQKSKRANMVIKTVSYRVLVVDDNALILDVLEDMLTSAGYAVKIADDPLKALEFISNEDFDVVITDLGMPNVDGWAVARHVKSKNALTPVILVTGWGTNYEKQDLSMHGVDILLSKPLGLEALVGAIDEVMVRPKLRVGRYRRHKRLSVKRGESARFTLLSTDSSAHHGEIMDISMGGLSFRHSGEEMKPGLLMRVEVDSQKGFQFNVSPAKIVYDMRTDEKSSSSHTGNTRRCGIQFVELSAEQSSHLKSFLRLHDIGNAWESIG